MKIERYQKKLFPNHIANVFLVASLTALGAKQVSIADGREMVQSTLEYIKNVCKGSDYYWDVLTKRETIFFDKLPARIDALIPAASAALQGKVNTKEQNKELTRTLKNWDYPSAADMLKTCKEAK